MNTPIETERKFLIRMPKEDILCAQNEIRIKSITQTYLIGEIGTTQRVRKILENGKECFLKTVKTRISALSQYEDEYEISREMYFEELKNADASRTHIEKKRYAFPFEGHIVEIDVFPFWSDRALLEIELSDENEDYKIPSFIDVIKEVSEDKRYKNTNLAISVPFDAI